VYVSTNVKFISVDILRMVVGLLTAKISRSMFLS